jgi:hypothetical protein
MEVGWLGRRFPVDESFSLFEHFVGEAYFGDLT